MDVLLLASGKSTRFNYHTKKQEISIDRKNIVDILIDTLTKIGIIKNIFIIVNKEYYENLYKQEFEISEKKIKYIIGGKTRILSIVNGFNNLDNKDRVIMIHDAARPLLYEQLVLDIYKETLSYGACGCYKELVSSVIKSENREKVTDSIVRSDHVESHTPQAFSYKMLANIVDSITESEIEKETELLNLSLKYNNKYPHIVKCDDRVHKLTYINDYNIVNSLSKVYKKKVLIIGATGDIGYEILNYLLLFNFDIYLGGRDIVKMGNINSDKIQDTIHLDLENIKTFNNLKDIVNDIDIFIFAHGQISFGKLDDYKIEEIINIINVNYTNNILLCKYIIDNIKDDKPKTFINISSSSIDKSRIYQQVYSSSKTAFHMFFKSLALEYKYKSMYFYNIVPRRTNTNKRKEQMQDQDFLDKDLLEPEEIAKTVYNTICMATSSTSGNDLWVN